MKPVPVDVPGHVRMHHDLARPCACILVTMAWCLPALAQNETPADAPKAPQGAVTGLGFPAAFPRLPSGFFVQDASVFSSALFQSLPGTPDGGAGQTLGAGSQTGFGFSVDAGWTRATPRTNFSVTSSSSLTEYEQGEQGHYWNTNINAAVKRQMTARLRSEVFTRVLITDQQQFLFGDAPQSRFALDPAIATTPAASNLRIAQRNLLVSAGGQVWYDSGPRTTLSLEAETVHNGPLGSGDLSDSSGNVAAGAYSSWSESATGTLAYTFSRRTVVDFSVAAVRTTSPLDRSVYGSTLAAYSHAINERWVARVHGGLTVGTSSADPASPWSTLSVTSAPHAYPIGGVSVEYRQNMNALVLSTNRGVTEIYGAGAAIVWGTNATWTVATKRSGWSFLLGTGYDLTSSGIEEHVNGWRANAGINRPLSQRWSASFQYGFLSSAYRYPASMESAHSHGLRLALVWTPARRGGL